MNKMQQQVMEFHKTYGSHIEKKPALPDFKTMVLRLRLMKEELGELERAMEDEDLVNIADGLADLMVVTLGTAISYGIDIEPVFNEVHRSNMTKTWPDGSVKKDAYGKILKPDTYSPPKIMPILDGQEELE